MKRALPNLDRATPYGGHFGLKVGVWWATLDSNQ